MLAGVRVDDKADLRPATPNVRTILPLIESRTRSWSGSQILSGDPCARGKYSRSSGSGPRTSTKQCVRQSRMPAAADIVSITNPDASLDSFHRLLSILVPLVRGYAASLACIGR